jgi:methylglyoxal synthase
MMQNTITMRRNKKIALAAHDNKKELFEWAKCNCKLLAKHSLHATGATAQLLKSRLGLNVTHLESGPLGGDQQIGSRISEGQIDFVIFFSDPLEPQPHDADVKALLRIAVVWNIPVACNRASADFIISSPLMSTVYERKLPDYSRYRARLTVRSAEGDVVDASVTPSIVRGNNKAAVITIVEEAADVLTGKVTAEEESRAWQEM